MEQGFQECLYDALEFDNWKRKETESNRKTEESKRKGGLRRHGVVEAAAQSIEMKWSK
jgi:hypothetical protein